MGKRKKKMQLNYRITILSFSFFLILLIYSVTSLMY